MARGPRSGSGASHRKGAAAEVRAKAAAGATILYGGMGMVLQMGIAPAAGLTMVALSDEAGEPIAEWARRRSPRFYKFLATLEDTVGAGKFLGAPVLAEAYARTPVLREPLTAPLIATLGQGDAEKVHSMAVMYDEAKAERAAARNGAVPPESMFPMPEPPSDE